MSRPASVNLREPWRFVMAVFLHGSLMHIGFNMWVLMDIGPQLEELYGSAKYWFIYVIAGIGGYIVSSFFGAPERRWIRCASGPDWGYAGDHDGASSAGMRMLRQQLIRWLIYIVILGFVARVSLTTMRISEAWQPDFSWAE